MSLTVFYRGQNVRFSAKLTKPMWVTLTLVFAIVSGLIVHQILSPQAVPDNVTTPVKPTKDHVASAGNKQEITAVTMKLAELQSQILRLNALGERLADDANIPKDEFNFTEQPPSGGPQSGLSGQELGLSMSQLIEKVNNLAQQLAHEEKQLKMLESLSLGHHIESSSYLSGRPIKKGWLSSYYGVRKDPFSGAPAMHKGVDFAGEEGADVIATGAGVVSWAGERYGYGNLVEITHPSGLKTRYGHNKQITVDVGDVVEKGQTIAKIGSTGRSTGPHVHYEILRGNQQINPIKYVYRKPKK